MDISKLGCKYFGAHKIDNLLKIMMMKIRKFNDVEITVFSNGTQANR